MSKNEVSMAKLCLWQYKNDFFRILKEQIRYKFNKFFKLMLKIRFSKITFPISKLLTASQKRDPLCKVYL